MYVGWVKLPSSVFIGIVLKSVLFSFDLLFICLNLLILELFLVWYLNLQQPDVTDNMSPTTFSVLYDNHWEPLHSKFGIRLFWRWPQCKVENNLRKNLNMHSFFSPPDLATLAWLVGLLASTECWLIPMIKMNQFLGIKSNRWLLNNVHYILKTRIKLHKIAKMNKNEGCSHEI